MKAFPVRAFGNAQPAPAARNRGSAFASGLSAFCDCAGGLFGGNGCAVFRGLLWCSGFAFAHNSNTVLPFFSACKGFLAVPFLRVSTPRHHWQMLTLQSQPPGRPLHVFSAYALGFRALPHQSHLILLSSSLILPPSVCAACRPQQTQPLRNHRTQPRRVANRPPRPSRQTTTRRRCRIPARALGRIGFGRFPGIGRIASLVLLGFILCGTIIAGVNGAPQHIRRFNLLPAASTRGGAGRLNHAAGDVGCGGHHLRFPPVNPSFFGFDIGSSES